MILFLCTCFLLLIDVLAILAILFWKKKALRWHKLADERLQSLEPLKMEKDEWEQRCAYLTAELAKLQLAPPPFVANGPT